MKRKRRKLKLKASESAKAGSPEPGKADAYVLHLRRPMPVARAVRWAPLHLDPPRPGKDDSAADEESSYEIFVSQAALREVQEHVWETDSRAHWGFLLGSLFECPETRSQYTVVESVLRGSGFFEEGNQGAILATAWAAMEKERHRIGAELLGWYHSHPHLGVVVSEADAQSHLTRFEEPWHCMLVMTQAGSDPAAGFFRSTGRGGLSRRHPVPFYELLEPESLVSDTKRTHLVWNNYRTDDVVAREGDDRPSPPSESFVTELQPESFAEPVVDVLTTEEPAPESVVEAEPEPVAEAAPEPVIEAEPEPEPEPVAEAEPEREPEPVAEAQPEPVAEPEPEPVAEAQPEPFVEPKPEPVAEAAPEPRRDWDVAAAAAGAPSDAKTRELVGATGKSSSRKLERLPTSRVDTPELVIPVEVESTLVPFARRANGGLIGMLAALGLLFVVVYMMNWTSEADGDQPEAVMPVEASVNPPVGRFEAHMEALNLAIISYGERQVDFDLGRISCDGLGLGYGEVDDTFVSTSLEFVASRSLLTLRQRQEYDSLVLRMDDVNTHFDNSGCPRPD